MNACNKKLVLKPDSCSSYVLPHPIFAIFSTVRAWNVILKFCIHLLCKAIDQVRFRFQQLPLNRFKAFKRHNLGTDEGQCSHVLAFVLWVITFENRNITIPFPSWQTGGQLSNCTVNGCKAKLWLLLYLKIWKIHCKVHYIWKKKKEENEFHARFLCEFLLNLKMSCDKEKALGPKTLQLRMCIVPLLCCGFNYKNVSQWLSNSSWFKKF